MHIDLIKTKVKMTKSTVLQMQGVNTEILRDGEVLGYIIKVDKYAYQTVIIKWKDNYYRVVAGFEKSYDSLFTIYRRIGRYFQKQLFKTAEDRDEYMRHYDNVIVKAVTQIYV